jgi:hypothetical protein
MPSPYPEGGLEARDLFSAAEADNFRRYRSGGSPERTPEIPSQYGQASYPIRPIPRLVKSAKKLP